MMPSVTLCQPAGDAHTLAVVAKKPAMREVDLNASKEQVPQSSPKPVKLTQALAGHTRRPSDAELAQRVLNGDEEAFGVLFRRYQALVHVVIFRVVGRPQIVEDLVQETFLKVFLHLHALEEAGRFRSWLTRIAANCARDHLRKAKPRERVISEGDAAGLGESNAAPWSQLCSSSVGANEVAEANELHATVNHEINALPKGYRGVAKLRYLGGATYPEIAQILDLPRETIKRRSGRARVMLQERLRGLGWGESIHRSVAVGSTEG